MDGHAALAGPAVMNAATASGPGDCAAVIVNPFGPTGEAGPHPFGVAAEGNFSTLGASVDELVGNVPETFGLGTAFVAHRLLVDAVGVPREQEYTGRLLSTPLRGAAMVRLANHPSFEQGNRLALPGSAGWPPLWVLRTQRLFKTI